MKSLPVTLLLLTLAACKGGSISTDSGLDDSAADDTETEGDADADSDADSDADADTDSDADADAQNVTFDLGEDGDGVYTYGTFGATLPYEFNPYVTVGYQYVDGDQTSGPAGYDYVHYAVGVNKTLGHFTADLSWQDARDLSGCNDNCEAVVFSVSSSW